MRLDAQPVRTVSKKPFKQKSKPKMSTRKKFSKAVKQEAMENYNNTCGVCFDDEATDPHHIRFKSSGGKSVLTNLLPVCRPCHIEIHKNADLAMKIREEAKRKHGNFYWADEWDVIK